MRGFGFREHGGLDHLEFVDVAEPTVGPGEVRVRLRAAGFNRLDRFTLEGIPGVAIERPHVLGSDGAGVVDRVGDGVSDLSVGESVLLNPGIWDGTCDECRSHREVMCRQYRILGEHTQGTATTLVSLPRRNVHPMPARLGFAEAAAAPLVFQTAWRALRTVGAVAPGERVAIVGAGGGVATAAIQVARRLGATVAVASHSPKKEPQVRALGVDAFVAFDADHPLERALWQWSEKKGVDVIFDSVGAPTVPRSVKALARGGRLVVVGATAGPSVEVDLRTLFWRQASIRGSTMAGPEEFEEVLGELAAGRLTPVVDSQYPLDRAPEAFARFASAELFGKIVLTIPPA